MSVKRIKITEKNEVTIQLDREYRPKEIADLQLITNSNNKGDHHLILRLIKSGKLAARTYNISKYRKYYLVKGSEIIRYLDSV